MHDLFQLLIVQPIFNALMLLYSIIPWHDFGLAKRIILVFTQLLANLARILARLMPRLLAAVFSR
jgi:hypothetical protein